MSRPPTPLPKPNFLTCPVETGEKGLVDAVVRQEASRTAPPAVAVSASSAHTPLGRAIPPVRPPALPSTIVPPPRLRRAGMRAVWVTLAVVLVLLGLLAPAIYGLARAAQSGVVAKNALDAAVTHMANRDVDAARQELDRAYDALVTTRQALRGMGLWRDAPSIGTQVRALEDAAGTGVAIVDALRDLLAIAEDLLDAAATVDVLTGELLNPVASDRSFNDLSAEEKRAILARLSRALPDIRAAQVKVDVALSTWERIPQDALYAPIQRAFAPIAANLPKLKQTLDEAVPLLEVLIPLAGYPEPTEYLVVLQNSDEIRATGGFLGTVGTVHMDGGDITQFEFDDVYALDNPATTAGWREQPPAPLREWLGAPAWFFRDANWSPDFPTSAAKLSDFYVRETRVGTGRQVAAPDGVIAMNAPVFQQLLRMVGPITVDGVTFTPDNFFEELEHEVEIRFLEKGIPVSERKQILIKVGDELMRRLTSLPAAEWPRLLDIVWRGFEHKQIQMTTRNPKLMATLDSFGWTGRAKPTQGDFVWVIDSNLAALKTDGVMQKRILYSVDTTAPGGPIATLTLRYTNNGPGIGRDFRFTRYRDYVRVYVPQGAELIQVDGAMKNDRYLTGGRPVPGRVDVYKELGKTVFGAFWSIEPTATQDITFRYRLPPSTLDALAENRYRLDVPKQSGNDTVALTVDLKFTESVQRATPGEETSQFGDTSYRVETDTARDRVFEIQFDE